MYILGYIGQDRIKFRAELPLGIPSKGAATFPLDLTGKWQIFFVETQELVPPDINPYDSWSLLFFQQLWKWKMGLWKMSSVSRRWHFPLLWLWGKESASWHNRFQLSGCPFSTFWMHVDRLFLTEKVPRDFGTCTCYQHWNLDLLSKMLIWWYKSNMFTSKVHDLSRKLQLYSVVFT